jgi:hypothetical protein
MQGDACFTGFKQEADLPASPWMKEGFHKQEAS